MRLTGKAKRDFEKWCVLYIKDQRPKWVMFSDEAVLTTFNSQIDSQKYGVYVDWFDSVGMQIYVKPTPRKEWSVYIDEWGHHILTSYNFAASRPEARTAAIKKATEIYNKRYE